MSNSSFRVLATLVRAGCLGGMSSARACICLLFCAGAASAQVSLRVPNEIEPPGGILEMKVALTEPEPIVIGGIALQFDPGPLGSVQDVALFSPGADVTGTAVVAGNRIYIAFNSPGGSFGTGGRDLVIAAVAIPVRADAAPGDQSNLIIDAEASWWTDPGGQPYTQEATPGLLTVGGNLSVSEVVPGSAVLPAGSTFTVRGMGFQPGVRLQLEGVDIASRFVSANEIEGTVLQETRMHGQRVRIRNPDRTTTTYASFMRSVPMGESSRPLLAQTVPVFSQATFVEAYFNPNIGADRFEGLAFQTPGADSADIAIKAYSAVGELLGSTNFSLPAGMRISRDVSEFLPGVTFTAGSYLRVFSQTPVQMLGLIGDEAAGTVLPLDPSPAPP